MGCLEKEKLVNHYLVFGSSKRPLMGGGGYLDWSAPPIGVYAAEGPEEACRSAAKDHGSMGTYFAVEGFPWGLELMDTPARQLGRTANVTERLSAHLDRMEELENERTRLLEQKVNNGGE
jgi:hypothetical protein